MSIRTSSQLGAAIRQQRKNLGLSQADLAKKIGTSRQWVIELEKGHSRAELGSVLRAINELGLTLQIYIENPIKIGRSSPDIDAIVDSARRKQVR
jgi:HTH-type transcriptional regulator / antitoxin HipB